ncbi:MULTISPECIES: YdbL family protein [unclassified Sphingomonas]|uniref:YdbL family protein n=1 Tax=unclassified Sphingomonas TaxID=196159 RepID=UPI0022B57B22|nr:YdbL family protein [Sphingomonas sp. NIBR02145]WHU04600.1 YdbL family protein [Sphingomonas sp. NIBR02145]
MRNMLSTLGLSAALAAGLIAPAFAQRDPAYQAAREDGLVGEQPDGYIGIVGAATPALQAIVNNINIQRKSQYTKQAAASSTVEQMAFVTGCNLILRTVPGEKYRAPDGRWLTRGNDAPVRDPRCL